MIILREVDNRMSQLVSDETLLKKIRRTLSIPKKLWKPKPRVIPQCLIGITGRFRTGFRDRIVDYLISNDYDCIIETMGDLPEYDAEDLWLAEGIDEYRDYQLEAVFAALDTNRGLLDLAPSAGKTLIVATLIMTKLQRVEDLKAMFVVSSVALLHQAKQDFVDYGIREDMITLWGDGNVPNFETPILIATSQSLTSSLENGLQFTADRQLLVVDEVDLVRPGTGIEKLVDKHAAYFRYGCSGSIPREDRDGDEKWTRWKLMANFGGILIRKSAKELRTEGHIADIAITMLRLNYKGVVAPKTYFEEIDFFGQCKERTRLFGFIADGCEGNVLVIVDRLEQLDELENYFDGTRSVYRVDSTVPSSERQSIFDKTETESGIIIIATVGTMSRGVSIRNLHDVVVGSIAISYSRLLQVLGRVSRLHESKDLGRVWDIADQIGYSERHSKVRVREYSEVEELPMDFIDVEIDKAGFKILSD